MVLLAIEIISVWIVIALVTGLAIGILIQMAERSKTEAILTTLFATLEAEQIVH